MFQNLGCCLHLAQSGKPWGETRSPEHPDPPESRVRRVSPEARRARCPLEPASTGPMATWSEASIRRFRKRAVPPTLQQIAACSQRLNGIQGDKNLVRLGANALTTCQVQIDSTRVGSTLGICRYGSLYTPTWGMALFRQYVPLVSSNLQTHVLILEVLGLGEVAPLLDEGSTLAKAMISSQVATYLPEILSVMECT